MVRVYEYHHYHGRITRFQYRTIKKFNQRSGASRTPRRHNFGAIPVDRERCQKIPIPLSFFEQKSQTRDYLLVCQDDWLVTNTGQATFGKVSPKWIYRQKDNETAQIPARLYNR